MACIPIPLVLGALCLMLKDTGVHAKLTNEKDELNAAEMDLPYWDPKPSRNQESNLRRKLVDGNFSIEPISRSFDNALPSIRKGRPREPTVKWSSHEDDSKMTSKRRRGVKVTIKFEKHHSRGNRSELRTNDLRSTRVAPMHLLQQKPEVEQHEVKKMVKHNRDQNHNEEPFVLNAYDVENQFTKLLSEFDDAEFTSEVLGRTASYINIVLFKIIRRGSKYFRARETKYVETESQERKIVFIVHALSPMGLGNLCTLTIETHLRQLLSYYLEHLDKFDIYLIPMANPDGYGQVRKYEYWNKNCAVNAQCPGVALDRNFDVSWSNLNNDSSEMSSCSQNYPGAGPFSEPETRAVKEVFHRKSHKIVAYIHVHGATYNKYTLKGDAVLYPKGYSDQQSDDDKYMDLKGEIDEAMKNANFKVLSVSVETLYSWYGKVTGTSVDFASSVYGIPYAMEFVMQLYQDPLLSYSTKIMSNPEDFDPTMMDYHSLTQIWKRVIEIVFTNIHKKLEATDNARDL